MVTLVPKPLQEENTTDLHGYRCKTPQQNTSKLKTATYKKDYTPLPGRIYPRNSQLI